MGGTKDGDGERQFSIDCSPLLKTKKNKVSGEIIQHERENNEVSEEFLKDNGAKFNNDCIKVLRLLYTGRKYTAKEINDTLNMADGGRRLRDIYANRKDCKRQKRYKADGHLEGMEYFLDIPVPTKKQVIEKWSNCVPQDLFGNKIS